VAAESPGDACGLQALQFVELTFHSVRIT